MSNSITPSPSELLNEKEDDLREVLSELNSASLRKLSREAIMLLAEQQIHIQRQNKKIELLYGRLNNIVALAHRELDDSNCEGMGLGIDE